MKSQFDIPVVVKKEGVRKRHAEIVMQYVHLRRSGVKPGSALDQVALCYAISFQYAYRIVSRSGRM